MPILSADGNHVAFVSRAPNLVTNPTSGSYQIFLRSLVTNRIDLVSVTPDGRGGNDHSLFPSISASGNLIVFESDASDLVSGDTNGVTDIFIRDVGHRQTWLLTGGNGPSRNPTITSNGYVAFESRASNLAPDDNNNAQDVFIRDVASDTSSLVTVNASGSGSPNRGSELLAITPNGRFVAFWSDATDISPDVTNTVGEVYVRDVQSGTTYCLTRSYQVYTSYRRFRIAITPDGAHAALQELSYSGAAGGGRVFRASTFTGAVTNLYCCGRPGSGLAISDDGQRIIFPGNDGLYLHDASAPTNRLLIRDVVSGFETPLNVAGFSVSRDFQKLWFVLNSTNTGAQLFLHKLSDNQTVLVSTNRQGFPINAPVLVPFSISDSGALAAFETRAGDVVTNDFNVAPDVYVSGSFLVSSNAPELRPVTAVGYARIVPTSANATGGRIAFISTDSILAPNDTNQYQDLFVHDFSSNRVNNVDGVFRSNSVYSVAFAADGASVVFERFGTEDFIGIRRGDLWRADLRSGNVTLLQASPGSFNPHWRLSLSQDGRWMVVQDGDRIRMTDFRTPPIPGQANFAIVDMSAVAPRQGNGPSSSPVLSLDGDWIAFASRAGDLVVTPQGTTAATSIPQVFATKFNQEPIRLVSVTPSGMPQPAGGTNPVISANARFVAYQSYTGQNIYRHDLLATGSVTNVLVCSGCSRPSISGDGRFVVYYGFGQPFIRDVESGTTEPIGEPGARDATISIDGRFVVFAHAGQIYLRDGWNNTTDLLTRSYKGGNAADGPSMLPLFAHDGRSVVFHSFASDLVPGDYNERGDVFVVRIHSVDSDTDGIDDDWETHYFGNLTHDASADSDGDGHTDAQEYLAGSDPTDHHSVLRASTGSRRVAPGIDETELKWTSAPGKTYRLQHTPALGSPWEDRLDILSGGSQASTPVSGNGFYRLKVID